MVCGFPSRLDCYKDKIVVHHYWIAAMGAHWLLCDNPDEPWNKKKDIWEGFVIMPWMDEDGEWGTMSKRELDVMTHDMSLGFKMPVKVENDKSLGRFEDVVRYCNIFS